MDSSWLLVMFVASVMAQNDLSVDCSGDAVIVSWRPKLDLLEKLNLSRAMLGNCSPSFLGSDETLRFYVSLQECGFHKRVSVNRVMYSSVLIYDRGPGISFISQSLQCVYDLPLDEMTAFTPEDEKLGGAEDEMMFSMEIMNGDFSGPAQSLTFKLGSRIPIRAEVHSHRSLLVFLERCEASTDSDISHDIISNSGCLMESKEGNSTFLPRLVPSEIRLYLEAFKFALGEKIFLHCDLMARDVRSLMIDGKACHYVKGLRRWELLDDPSQSSVCLCCELTCPWRTDNLNGISARKVLGPLRIVEDQPESSSYTLVSEEGLSKSQVWLLVTLVMALLVIVMGVMGMSYYQCVWRGGRVGYRPRRDLLRKS